MAANFIVVGAGNHELEVNSTYPVPIVVFSGNLLGDPASIVLVLRDPDSTSFTFTYPVGATLVTRSGVGLYSFTFSPVLVGRHVYTVTTTLPSMVVSGEFTVIDNGVN